MARYIDADKMLADESEAYMSAQIKLARGGKNTTYYINEIVHKKIQMLLVDAPAEDVRENVKGEWIEENLDNFRKYKVTCPICKSWYIGNYDAYDEPYDFNFCPNCGAELSGCFHVKESTRMWRSASMSALVEE